MTRRQCPKCPWRVTTNPFEIPEGYSVAKHRALSSTIAKPGDLSEVAERELRIMTCHETDATPCNGWLVNQLGPGNNIALRLAVMSGGIDGDVEVDGEQHPTLADTLPKGGGPREPLGSFLIRIERECNDRRRRRRSRPPSASTGGASPF